MRQGRASERDRRLVLGAGGLCSARTRVLCVAAVAVAGALACAPSAFGHGSDTLSLAGAGNETLVQPGTQASPAGDPGEELAGLRTRTSRTYMTGDEQGAGSRLVRVSAGSINYRGGDGRWRAIDNSLVSASGGGFTNKANRYDAQLPDRLSDGDVRVGEGGDAFSFSLRDADPGSEGRVDGARIVYPDAFPGVDVSYQAQADTLEELLTLASADARRSFVYDLRISDLDQ